MPGPMDFPWQEETLEIAVGTPIGTRRGEEKLFTLAV